ncbi:ATP-binding cassette domain-containing protein [Pseudonocardia sulfidoxydans]|uniref:ATP-binding cassette domain-containing protein n=1 Tax=Pseudonocardia sulfidoxydans TaxID=54011 RepID=UPI001649E296|nr:sugar ABC transporter ATP-binding protein [Pseudonocardia sulfidoxydans]
MTLRGLRKSFGPNAVLVGLDLTIREGEFVGLMGPNGAGKSTLIKILDGVHAADEGAIEFRGRPVGSFTTLPEVGFVHQDLGIVDDLTVVENLRLGLPPLRRAGPLLDLGAERGAASEALRRVALDVPLDLPARELSAGEKALLAVARLLSTGARFLVIDEATSTLPPNDARRFIATLKDLTSDGATVLFVSHKLSEVRSCCDRVVLLLDGAIAFDEELDPDNEGQLAEILGHQTAAPSDTARVRRAADGRAVFALDRAFVGQVGPVDLHVERGEVVGLTGLVGSGLHDVAYLAAGIARPRSGARTFHGRRLAIVAPQRETEGTIADISVSENLTLSALPQWRRRGLLSLRRERRDVEHQVDALNVQPPDPDLPLGALSGGNQQKVLFGRALVTGADFLIICEPTRGVDIATRHELYRVIHELAAGGVAILVVTSDAEDLFAVCDRVGVLHEGSVRGPWPRSELDAESMALVL